MNQLDERPTIADKPPRPPNEASGLSTFFVEVVVIYHRERLVFNLIIRPASSNIMIASSSPYHRLAFMADPGRRRRHPRRGEVLARQQPVGRPK